MKVRPLLIALHSDTGVVYPNLRLTCEALPQGFWPAAIFPILESEVRPHPRGG